MKFAAAFRRRTLRNASGKKAGGWGKKYRTYIERSKINFITTYHNQKYRFIIQILNKVNTLLMFTNLI